MGKLREQLAQARIERERFDAQLAERERRAALSDREQSLTYLLIGLAAFYLAVRFGFTTRLDAISEYATYLFEIGLVGYAALLLRPRLSLMGVLKPLPIAASIAAIGAGTGVLKITRVVGIAVPFNVSNRETVFFLLAVAPILEEFVFRFLLWKPIERAANAQTAWWATSLAFSYSHLHAIWFVPPEYQKFLIYQTAYTLPLGLACGWMLRKQKSLLSSMLLHFAFNLGFFFAFWF